MPGMNSRERMAVAMARRKPDRVPVMCQLALGHYFLNTALDALSIWHDSDVFARALVDLQQRYGFDGILVNLPGRDPGWEQAIVAVEPDPHEEAVRRIRWKNGMVTVLPPDDNPHVVGRDGVRVFPALEEIDPEGLFYMEPHDISGIDWPFTWGFEEEPAPVGGPEFFPPWQCSTLRKVRELTGGAVSVHSEIFSPFSQLIEMLDVTHGLMALLLDEGRVKACLDRFAEGALTLGLLYAGEGCDALLISSAYTGGGLISRDQYAAFELPYLRKVIQGIKASHPDLPVYVHTCGAIGDRLDLMEASGADGIDTLDPPPLGTVELGDAVARLGGRLFIKGNIDPVGTLLDGTPGKVRAAARERLAIAGPGGAYVLSSACSVPPHTPPENILELRRAVEEEDGE